MFALENLKNTVDGYNGYGIHDFDYVLAKLQADNIQYQLIQDTISGDKNYLAIQIVLPNKIILLSPNTQENNLRMNINIIPVLTDNTMALSSNSIVEDVLELTEDNINNVIGYIKGVKSISLTFKDK